MRRSVVSTMFVGLLLGTGIFTASCNQKAVQQQQESTVSVVDYVNPFIGTSNRGNTYPGAVMPWGMASPNPQTKDFRLKAETPATYEFGDEYIYGFSSVNLSGVGCPGAGSVPFKISKGNIDMSSDSFRSKYSSEVANPGYYGVTLDKHNIKAEMTATVRTARYRFTPNNKEGNTNVYIDLSAPMSHMKGGQIAIDSEGIITGYQLDGEFCDCEGIAKIYFAVEFITPFDKYEVYNNQEKVNENSVHGSDVGIALKFDNLSTKSIEVKVGVSFVSIENAKLNLKVEQEGKPFEILQQQAERAWEKQLSKVDIEGGTKDEQTVFYTALYHSLVMPHVISDVNGQYPVMHSDSSKVAKDYTRYSTFSLWDTYRSVHPLLALLYPEQQRDMVTTMIEMYKESGWLPKWELYGNESWVMVGDPAVPVIVDTYMKGITNFDTKTALEAMVKGASQKEGNPLRPGLKNYIEKGYIPIDDRGGDPMNFTFHNGIVWGPVSTTLEYNFADYAIAKFAEALGEAQLAEKYFEQSQSYKKLYDAETAFFRPKQKDGQWMSPFNPLDRHYDIRWKGSGGKGYVEGTAWQYAFFVPHAIDTLKQLMGEEQFFAKLNTMFEKGHFDLTNEPDITYPFLFNYLEGKHRYAQSYVTEQSETHFNNTPSGIPGNDDAGTMSAWLVFAQLGIFPDAPGIPLYQLTTPKFSKATLHLDEYIYGGKDIVLEKTKEGKHFDKVKKEDGTFVKGFSITHDDLIKSGKLSYITEVDTVLK